MLGECSPPGPPGDGQVLPPLLRRLLRVPEVLTGEIRVIVL